LPAEINLRDEALAAFSAGLEWIDPGRLLERRVRFAGGVLEVAGRKFDLKLVERVLVVAFGKAAVRMTAALEGILGERIEKGMVLSNSLPEALPGKYDIHRCSHPLPDESNLKAGQVVLELVREAGDVDLVICLISGGGSSILTAPVEGIAPAELRETIRLLMQAGAPIDKLNAVRKHVSRVKGGRLAAAIAPAGVLSLILSDVPGDDPAVIASGPTTADPSSFADAWNAAEELGVGDKLPRSVAGYLRRGMDGGAPETPKRGDAIFERVSNIVIGRNRDMLGAMEGHLRGRGFWTMQEREPFEGEARRLGAALAARVRELAGNLKASNRPYALLAGGESTVKVSGDGLGGRSSELALAAAIELDGCSDCAILAAGTDGVDGPSDAAGAIADGDSLNRARKLGLDARAALENNDAYNFFAPLGDLVVTGPTGTNLMDVTLALVGKQ
jgi:glycerate 2-kinase